MTTKKETARAAGAALAPAEAAALQQTNAVARGALATAPLRPQAWQYDDFAQRGEQAGLTEVIGAAMNDTRMTSWRWLDDIINGPSTDEDAADVAGGWSYTNVQDQVESMYTSWEDIEYLRENATGPRAMAAAMARLEERKYQNRVYAEAGTFTTVVGSLAAGITDPTALVTGMAVNAAVFRGALGVERAIRAGKAGRAVGIVAAEGAIGELAFTYIQDQYGEVMGIDDYVTGAAFGAAAGLAFSRGTYRKAAEQAALNDLANIADNVVRDTNVPPEVHADRVLRDADQPVDDTRQVIPRDLQDEIARQDVGEVEPTVADVPTTPVTPEPVEPPPVEVIEDVPVPTTQDLLDPAAVVRVADEFVALGDPVSAYRLLSDFIEQSDLEPDQMTEVMEAWVRAGDSRTTVGADDVAARDADDAARAIIDGERLRVVPTGNDGRLLISTLGIGPEQIAYNKKAIASKKATATRKGNGWVEMTADKALDYAMNSTQPVWDHLRPLMTLLAQNTEALRNMKFTLASGNVRGASYAGGDIVSGTGMVNKNDLQGTFDYMNQWSADVVVHEMVHSFTSNILRAAENPRARNQLSPQVLRAVEALENGLVAYRAELEARGLPTVGERGTAYGAKNVHEFVAMAMTDLDTQRILVEMPASPAWGGRFGTMMQQVIGMVRKIVGAHAEGSRLDEVHAAFDTLFRAYDDMAVHMRGGVPQTKGRPAPALGSAYEVSKPLWDDPAWVQQRDKTFSRNNPATDMWVQQVTDRRMLNAAQVNKLPAKTAVLGRLREERYRFVTDAVESLRKKWLPDSAIVLGDKMPSNRQGANGVINTIGDNHVIGLNLDNGASPVEVLRTAIHEIGHAIFHTHAREVDPAILARMKGDFNEFVTSVYNNDPDAVNRRFSVTSINRRNIGPGKGLKSNEYALNFDEFTAEQFVKFIESRLDTPKAAGLVEKAAKFLKSLFRTMQGVLDDSRANGWLRPTDSFESFFLDILRQQESRLGAVVKENAAAVNPVAVVGTRRRFAGRMYEHARDYVSRNPIDMARLRVITAKIGGLSDGLRLAGSNNPILQMVAGIVTETTTGAAGRGATVAIRKEMLRTRLTGNSILDYNRAYEEWGKRNGRTLWNDVVAGDKRREFDRAVYMEILRRRDPENTTVPPGDPAVMRAAQAMEDLFGRALKAQKDASVLGADRLPEDSIGYVPQALDGRKLAEATPQELGELVTVLAQQFENNLGWSRKFAGEFADFYVQRARNRAMNPTAKDFAATAQDNLNVIRDSLMEMGEQTRDPALRQEAERNVRGMGQTKKRLRIDLLADLPGGKKVLDFYEDNPLYLSRRYINRTSGVIALTEGGIPGDVGVKNLRDALSFHDNPGEAATREELAAFDRVMADILGMPVPGEVISHNASALRLLTSLQRLGGMAWTQAGEFVNAVHHLGLAHTLAAIPAIPRMFGEVGRIKKGQDPRNHILTSIETWGGEFGAHAYKMQMPLDPPDNRLTEYVDNDRLIDRLLRAGNFAQAKVSGFRALMAVQHRMVAEQIVMKAARYLRQDTPQADRWLADMGITDELLGHMKLHLPQVAQWDRAGKLVGFDLNGLPNAQAKDQFVQAIHRGVGQIIQGHFVGETGAWAHNDYLKMLLQLRTFGLVAAEKQWGRAVAVTGSGAQGYATAGFLLMAQTAMVMPLIAARVYAASLGREDQEEFIQQQLHPVALVRSAMNYTSLSGLLGDTLDVLVGLSGGVVEAAGGDRKVVEESLGGRAGASSGVASVIPALGSIDAAAKVVTGRSSVYGALKQLPMSNLPFVVPVINLFREED